jgi:hypothetical protein
MDDRNLRESDAIGRALEAPTLAAQPENQLSFAQKDQGLYVSLFPLGKESTPVGSLS